MPEIRVKRKAPKVRTGCITCKSRHLKCDETKPHCLRCIRSKLRCEGYPPPPKAWIFEFPQPEQSATSTTSQIDGEAQDEEQKNVIISQPGQSKIQPVNHADIANPSGPVGSSYPFVSLEEQRAFFLYLERTCPSVTSYSDPETWRVLFPQLAWRHKAIKHAIVAVALLNECNHMKVRKPQGNTAIARALYHTNISIRALLTENPSIEVILASGLLFYLLEIFNHNAARALTHMHSTIKILDQHNAKLANSRAPSNASTEAVLKYIEPALRVGLKFSEVVYRQSLGKPAIDYFSVDALKMRQQMTRPGVRDQFVDLRDARETMGGFSEKIIQMRSSRGLGEVPCPDGVKKIAFIHFHFRRLFAPFPRDIPGNRMVNVHHQVLMMIFEDHIAPYQAPWIDGSSAVNSIHCNALVTDIATLSMNPEVRSNPQFQVELGLIPPLFYLATSPRCSHNKRLEAISALQELRRTEGGWTSCTASKIAQAILDLETSDNRQLTNPVIEIVTKGEEKMELWISFKIKNMSEEEESPSKETRTKMKANWSSPEVSWLPKNIGEIVYNYGYQGYFSDSTNKETVGHVNYEDIVRL